MYGECIDNITYYKDRGIQLDGEIITQITTNYSKLLDISVKRKEEKNSKLWKLSKLKKQHANHTEIEMGYLRSQLIYSGVPWSC